jgi:hypothetical protein
VPDAALDAAGVTTGAGAGAGAAALAAAAGAAPASWSRISTTRAAIRRAYSSLFAAVEKQCCSNCDKNE